MFVRLAPVDDAIELPPLPTPSAEEVSVRGEVTDPVTALESGRDEIGDVTSVGTKVETVIRLGGLDTDKPR